MFGKKILENFRKKLFEKIFLEIFRKIVEIVWKKNYLEKNVKIPFHQVENTIQSSTNLVLRESHKNIKAVRGTKTQESLKCRTQN